MPPAHAPVPIAALTASEVAPPAAAAATSQGPASAELVVPCSSGSGALAQPAASTQIARAGTIIRSIGTRIVSSKCLGAVGSARREDISNACAVMKPPCFAAGSSISLGPLLRGSNALLRRDSTRDYGGIPLETFAPDAAARRAVRSKLGIPDDALVGGPNGATPSRQKVLRAENSLAGCVPAVAAWRLVTLPKSLPSDQVERLLQSCDRSTAIGRRDYAILLLLVRLGLRAGGAHGGGYSCEPSEPSSYNKGAAL